MSQNNNFSEFLYNKKEEEGKPPTQPTYEELLAMYYKNKGGEPTTPLKEMEGLDMSKSIFNTEPNITPDYGAGYLKEQHSDDFLYSTADYSSNDYNLVDDTPIQGYQKEPKKDEKKNFWEQLANNPFAQSGAHLGIDDRFMMAGAGAAAGGTAGKVTAIAGITSGALGAARNFMSGYSLQKEGDRVQQEYLKNIKRANESNYQYVKGKDGGQIVLFRDGGMLNLTPEKQALNEYIAALPKSMQKMANAEIEKNEYIIEPDGSVKKAIGETHEKGGIKQFLQDGTRIVSDNLKVGKDIADVVKNRTGVKVKPNDTFAKVVDKYSDSIGLTKLNKEAEDAHKALKENQGIKDEQTRMINEKFLQEKLQEVESKRQSLLKNRLKFTDVIYAAQELNKQIPAYRQGGMHIDPNIAAIFKKNNISMEDGLNILQGFQEGGEMMQPESTDVIVMVNPETGDVAQVTTQEEFEQLSAMGYLTEEEYSMMLQQQEQQGMQQEQEQFKKGGEKMYSTYEDGGIITFTTSDKKGVKTEQKVRIKEGASKEEVKALIAQINEEKNLTKKKDFIISLEAKIADEDVPKVFSALQGTGETKQGKISELKPETRFQNATFTMAEDVISETEEADKTTQTNIENKIKGLDITQLQKPRSRIVAASPFNLPPPALQPHATVTYRPEYIDPMAISHEPMQQALLNQQANIMDRSGDLPLGMRGAFASTVGANTSEQLNKAVIETEKYNALNRQQTETINAQKSDMTEMQRIQEIPRYERLALTALAKTQNDVYNYFNTQTRNAQKKHQYLNNAQLIDSLFEKAYYDPTTGEVKVGANDKFTNPNK